MPLISYADQMRAASELFRNSMSELERQGVPYWDDRVFHAAEHAIKNFVPDIVGMTGERVVLAAELGIGVEGEETRSFSSLAVEAVLQCVRIQELQEQIEEDGMSFDFVRHDLVSVLVPRYTNPDPVDIVFGNELYVPFGTVTELNPR